MYIFRQWIGGGVTTPNKSAPQDFSSRSPSHDDYDHYDDDDYNDDDHDDGGDGSNSDEASTDNTLRHDYDAIYGCDIDGNDDSGDDLVYHYFERRRARHQQHQQQQRRSLTKRRPRKQQKGQESESGDHPRQHTMLFNQATADGRNHPSSSSTSSSIASVDRTVDYLSDIDDSDDKDWGMGRERLYSLLLDSSGSSVAHPSVPPPSSSSSAAAAAHQEYTALHRDRPVSALTSGSTLGDARNHRKASSVPETRSPLKYTVSLDHQMMRNTGAIYGSGNSRGTTTVTGRSLGTRNSLESEDDDDEEEEEEEEDGSLISSSPVEQAPSFTVSTTAAAAAAIVNSPHSVRSTPTSPVSTISRASSSTTFTANDALSTTTESTHQFNQALHEYTAVDSSFWDLGIVIRSERSFYRQSPFNEINALSSTHTDAVREMLVIDWKDGSNGSSTGLNNKQHLLAEVGHGGDEALDQRNRRYKRLLASISDDGTINVWDCLSCERIHTLIGHRLPVTCMAVMYRKTPAASSHSEESNSEDECSDDSGTGIDGTGGSGGGEKENVAFTQTLLISGSKDKTIKIWDLNDGRCLQTLCEHKASVKQICVLNEDRFCSGGNDADLCVWTVDGRLVGKIGRQEEENMHRMLSLPNNLIVTASDNPVMYVYDTLNLTCLDKRLDAHGESVQCLVMVNEKLFASASLDGTIVLWDSHTLKRIQSFGEGVDPDSKILTRMHSLVVINGKYLAAAMQKGFVVYDMDSGKCVMRRENAHKAAVQRIISLHHGNTIASCSDDSSIRFWYTRQRFSHLYPLIREHQEERKHQRKIKLEQQAAKRKKGGIFGGLGKYRTRQSQQQQQQQQQQPIDETTRQANLAKYADEIISPRLIGEAKLHSNEVLNLLALSEFSFSSCGSDAQVFIWKDRRLQKRIRSFIANQYLHLPHDVARKTVEAIIFKNHRHRPNKEEQDGVDRSTVEDSRAPPFVKSRSSTVLRTLSTPALLQQNATSSRSAATTTAETAKDETRPHHPYSYHLYPYSKHASDDR